MKNIRYLAIAIYFILSCSPREVRGKEQAPRIDIDCRHQRPLCNGQKNLLIKQHSLLVVKLPMPHGKFCAIKTPPLKIFAPGYPTGYRSEEIFFDPTLDFTKNSNDDLENRKTFLQQHELVINTASLKLPARSPKHPDLYIFSVRGKYELLVSDDLFADRDKPVYDLRLSIDFVPNELSAR